MQLKPSSAEPRISDMALKILILSSIGLALLADRLPARLARPAFALCLALMAIGLVAHVAR